MQIAPAFFRRLTRVASRRGLVPEPQATFSDTIASVRRW
jgi:hypothetical protein